MAHVRSLLRAGVSAALLVLGANLPAAAADFDPQNFEVNITAGDGFGPSGEPLCTDDAEGTTCVHDIDISLTDQEMSGTVSEATTGLSGTISMVCDITENMTFSWFMPFDPSGQPWGTASGKGTQACSWHMEFDDGVTSLTGTIKGAHEFGMLEGADVPTMYGGGTFAVVVVAGSGEFAGAVGEGTFSDYWEEPLGGGPSSPERGAIWSRAADSTGMALALRTGRYKAVFVSPSRGKQVRLTSNTPIQVVSVPSRTCNVAAVRAGDGMTRNLGSIRDANDDGLYQLQRFAEAIGKPGTWNLRAECSYRSGGQARTAVGSTQVDLVK